MLDALLPGVGCFRRGHRFGHMPFEWKAALARLVRDREVNIAWQPAIDLDEIHASLLLFGHGLATLCLIGGDNGSGINRVRTIDERTAEVNGGRRLIGGGVPKAPG